MCIGASLFWHIFYPIRGIGPIERLRAFDVCRGLRKPSFQPSLKNGSSSGSAWSHFKSILRTCRRRVARLPCANKYDWRVCCPCHPRFFFVSCTETTVRLQNGCHVRFGLPSLATAQYAAMRKDHRHSNRQWARLSSATVVTANTHLRGMLPRKVEADSMAL